MAAAIGWGVPAVPAYGGTPAYNNEEDEDAAVAKAAEGEVAPDTPQGEGEADGGATLPDEAAASDTDAVVREGRKIASEILSPPKVEDPEEAHLRAKGLLSRSADSDKEIDNAVQVAVQATNIRGMLKRIVSAEDSSPEEAAKAARYLENLSGTDISSRSVADMDYAMGQVRALAHEKARRTGTAPAAYIEETDPETGETIQRDNPQHPFSWERLERRAMLGKGLSDYEKSLMDDDDLERWRRARTKVASQEFGLGVLQKGYEAYKARRAEGPVFISKDDALLTKTPEDYSADFFKARTLQRDFLLNQLDYIAEHTPDTPEGQRTLKRVAKWRDQIEAAGNEFYAFSAGQMAKAMERVGALHREAVGRRGSMEVFWDALKRGNQDLGLSIYEGYQAIAPWTDIKSKQEQLSMLEDVVNLEQAAKMPKKFDSFRQIGSVGDAFEYVLEGAGENIERMGFAVAGAYLGGGIAGAAGAGSLGAAVASGAGSSLATMFMNTGEAVSDQLQEGLELSRGYALMQGSLYSVVDGAFGVETLIGKTAARMGATAAVDVAKSVGTEAAKGTAKEFARAADATVKGLREAGRMSTGKGAALAWLKGTAFEGVQEPAQSQIMGRFRRRLQTGSALREGETLEDAWNETLEESVGGMAAAIFTGGIGAVSNNARARSIANSSRKIVDTITGMKEFHALAPEQQLLVARHLQNQALLTTAGQTAMTDSQRKVAEAVNAQIERELAQDGVENKAARDFLGLVTTQFATEDFDATVKFGRESGLVSGITKDGMRKATTEIPLPDGTTGRAFVDPASGVSIVETKDRDGRPRLVVVNNGNLKAALTADSYVTLTDEDRAAGKTLFDKAVELAQDCDVYNQQRAKASMAKRLAIKRMAENLYGRRGVNVVVADNLSALARAAERGEVSANLVAQWAVNPGGIAATDAETNTIAIMPDRITSIGQLYTVLMHERGHLDIAEHLLGRSLSEREFTDEDRQRLAAGRERMFGGENAIKGAEGRLGAETAEEVFVERYSVSEILAALRGQSLGARVIDLIRRWMGVDTNFALEIIGDADARTELRHLVESGYLGKEVSEKAEPIFAEEQKAQERAVEQLAELDEQLRQRREGERTAMKEKAEGRAARKEAGHDAAVIIGEMNRDATADAARAEEKAGRVMAAAQGAKERIANNGGMLSADEAREQQHEKNDAAERGNAEQTARELRKSGVSITTNKEQLAREEAYPRRKEGARQEGQNETGNGADEAPAPARPEQGAREPQGGEAKEPVEGATPRGEAPREGVVEPQSAENRAETPAEGAGAKGGAEAVTTAPAPAKPAEAASGASGAKPSEEVPAKTTASAPAAPTAQPQTNKPNKESSPKPAPAPKSNRLRRRDGTDPIAEREAAKGGKTETLPATEPSAAKTEQKAETPPAPAAPEGKHVPMTPVVKKNRIAEVQKILANRPKDLPLTPETFMAHASDEAYASGRKKTAGLTLPNLRKLHGDKTWHNDLGLAPEEAQRVRDAVDRAFEYAYLGDRRGGKYEAVATALRFLDAKPDDLTAIARARTEIVNALDKAERKDKFGRQLLDKYLGEVMDKIAALPPEQRAKIPGLDKLNLKTIDRRARKNETSITNSEGKDMDIAVGERGVEEEEEVVDEDGKTAADKSISAEIDADARSSLFRDADDRADAPAAPPKGTRGQGGSLGGNRFVTINSVDGDSLTVTMKDAAGKVLVKGQKMTRADWAKLANVVTKGDPVNPKKGDLVRWKTAPVTDPDVVFGAIDSMAVHGYEFDTEDVRVTRHDKDLFDDAKFRLRDPVEGAKLVGRVLSGDIKMSDEDATSLIMHARNQLAALTDARKRAVASGVTLPEGNVLELATENAFKAVRSYFSNAGANLRLARWGAALDRMRDSEPYITEQVRAIKAEKGLPTSLTDSEREMVARQARELEAANKKIGELMKQIEDANEKANTRTAEAVLDRERRKAKAATALHLPTARRSKAEAVVGRKLNDAQSDALAGLDALFGGGPAKFKEGEGSKTGGYSLTPDVERRFADYVRSVGGNFAQAQEDLHKLLPKADAAFAAFREKFEGKALPVAEPPPAATGGAMSSSEEERDRVRREIEAAKGNTALQRKLLGRHLRKFMRGRIAENPALTNAEVFDEMAKEAKLVHPDGEYDAASMLSVLSGRDGFDLDTRSEVARRLVEIRQALTLARDGQFVAAAEKAGIPFMAESEMLDKMEKELQSLLDEQQDKVDEAVAALTPEDAAQIARIKEMQKRAAEIAKTLRSLRSDKSLAEKSSEITAVLNSEIAARQAQVDALRGEGNAERVVELKERINELKAAKRKLDRELRLEEKMREQVAELERRIREGDFETSPLVYAAMTDEARARLKREVEKKRALRQRMEEERRRRRYNEMSWLGKAAQDVGDILGESKAIGASFDISSVLRQGGQLSYAHPLLAYKNFQETLKSWKSGDYAENLMAQLRQRPNWKWYEAAGVEFTDWGENATNADDRYLLNKYRKLTSNKLLKAGINASERAFSMYLNLMRADVFDAMVRGSTFGDPSKMTGSQLKALGNFINIASQRGAMGKDAFNGGAGRVVQYVMWSPRNMVSRFQFLLNTAKLAIPGLNPYGDKTLRGLFAKELARYIGGFAAMAVLIRTAGMLFHRDDDPPDEMEFDPRSSDFLKVRWGNTRIDLSSGLTPLLVFGARMTTWETKNLRGQIKPTNKFENVGRLMRQKLSPAASFVWDSIARETFEHKTLDWGSFWHEDDETKAGFRHFVELFVPLTGRDIVEQARVGGVPRTVVTGALTALGLNVQAFNPYTYKDMSGDYTAFKSMYGKMEDREERRRFVELHPMLQRQGAIDAALKHVRRLEKERKGLVDKERDTKAIDERIADAKLRALNVMMGNKSP